MVLLFTTFVLLTTGQPGCDPYNDGDCVQVVTPGSNCCLGVQCLVNDACASGFCSNAVNSVVDGACVNSDQAKGLAGYNCLLDSQCLSGSCDESYQCVGGAGYLSLGEYCSDNPNGTPVTKAVANSQCSSNCCDVTSHQCVAADICSSPAPTPVVVPTSSPTSASPTISPTSASPTTSPTPIGSSVLPTPAPPSHQNRNSKAADSMSSSMKVSLGIAGVILVAIVVVLVLWRGKKRSGSDATSSTGDQYVEMTDTDFDGGAVNRPSVLTVVVSTSEHGPESKPGAKDGIRVMQMIEKVCKETEDLRYGYDWAGSTSADPRDAAVDWRNAAEVEGSYWFKGYCNRIKGQVLVLAQEPRLEKIVLMCIDGGPISQLEQRVMGELKQDIQRDLESKKISGTTIEVVLTSFEGFKERFLPEQPCTAADRQEKIMIKKFSF